EFVHSLGGKYITAEDVGMETDDMDLIRTVTPHVVGLSEAKGGKGNPSPITAYGVYMGMKASAKFTFGTDDLAGKTIFVQGVGHVGESLVKRISEEGANVYITDINREKLEYVRDKYGVKIYEGTDFYAEPMDIYSPCALGSTLNDDTIARLQAIVISGAANNQLTNENRHGQMLRSKGITYAPDFLINAVGIINVSGEMKNYG